MILPYVVVFDTWDISNYFCLDRNYNRIPDDQVEGMPITTDQIVQANIGVQATFSEIPQWAKDRPDSCVTIWTNYYSGVHRKAPIKMED